MSIHSLITYEQAEREFTLTPDEVDTFMHKKVNSQTYRNVPCPTEECECRFTHREKIATKPDRYYKFLPVTKFITETTNFIYFDVCHIPIRAVVFVYDSITHKCLNHQIHDIYTNSITTNGGNPSFIKYDENENVKLVSYWDDGDRVNFGPENVHRVIFTDDGCVCTVCNKDDETISISPELEQTYRDLWNPLPFSGMKFAD